MNGKGKCVSCAKDQKKIIFLLWFLTPCKRSEKNHLPLKWFSKTPWLHAQNKKKSSMTD